MPFFYNVFHCFTWQIICWRHVTLYLGMEVGIMELVSIFSRDLFFYLLGNNLGKGIDPKLLIIYVLKRRICICNKHCYSQIIVSIVKIYLQSKICSALNKPILFINHKQRNQSINSRFSYRFHFN